jgi:mediator of RNA polymerase II transcription subunit 13
LHHSLVCVIPDTPWFFLPSKQSPLNPIRSSPSSTKHSVIFTDISSTTYAIFPKVRLPISVSPSHSHLVSMQSFIPEPPISHPNIASPYPQPIQTSNTDCSQPAKPPSSLSRLHSETDRRALPLLPHSSSILIRIPHLHDSATASNNSMIHIHLLRTYHSACNPPPIPSQTASAILDDKQLLEDVTRNYYELSVLSKARWNLDGVGGHKGLPFHLAATDAKRMAFDRDWDRFDEP